MAEDCFHLEVDIYIISKLDLYYNNISTLIIEIHWESSASKVIKFNIISVISFSISVNVAK